MITDGLRPDRYPELDRLAGNAGAQAYEKYLELNRLSPPRTTIDAEIRLAAMPAQAAAIALKALINANGIDLGQVTNAANNILPQPKPQEGE